VSAHKQDPDGSIRGTICGALAATCPSAALALIVTARGSRTDKLRATFGFRDEPTVEEMATPTPVKQSPAEGVDLKACVVDLWLLEGLTHRSHEVLPVFDRHVVERTAKDHRGKKLRKDPRVVAPKRVLA
jgi:hypothetical protein